MIIEEVAEIDVAHGSERDDMREADIAARGPVEHRSRDRTGLASRRRCCPAGREMGKARIDASAGRHDAEAVRPDDSQQIRLCRIQHRLAYAPALGTLPLSEACCDHDCGAAATRTELADKRGTLCGGVLMTARSGVSGSSATDR